MRNTVTKGLKLLTGSLQLVVKMDNPVFKTCRYLTKVLFARSQLLQRALTL
jgi:hypothetical protein